MIEQLGRYKVLEKIGQGGFAVVYRAHDTELKRQVALKELRQSLLADVEGVKRSKREARTIAGLDHHRVVTIYDVVELEKRLFIVMRLVDGPSLDQVIAEQGGLPWPETLDIMNALAEGLDAAHAQGILHRDLKPANILMDSERGPLLTDFGLAKLADEGGTSITAAGGVVGSPHYIAPEVWDGQGSSPQSDIYALGCILYEMLTAEKAVPGATPPAIMMGHFEPLALPESWPEDVPSGVGKVLQAALAKAPTDRYGSARELAAALNVLATTPDLSFQPPIELQEEPPEEEAQIFVARESELAQLTGFLEQAIAGQGRVVFITGEAGAGKTTLVTEFVRQAQQQNAELLFAVGNCNAQTGLGDPYLPFREIIGLLTGDVETKLAQGAITVEDAQRLKKFVRVSGEVLVELGPMLINTLVPGAGLVTRVGVFVAGKLGWFDRLKQLNRGEATTDTNVPQARIFEQYTTVLQAMATKQPLVLWLDDLHWVDPSSASLLFHLGRALERSRILVVGTYRPEDVALGRGTEPHPLADVVNEFKRYWGDIQIDLDQAKASEGRHFVDALLDTKPNRLDEVFRQALYTHTGGHPLFTVELLRNLQEREEILPDEAGRWVAKPDLDWDALPARVEGVIEKRIGRLTAEMREALTIASIEGEQFTAEVVARVQDVPARDLVRQLSREVDKQHRLVQARGSLRLGSQRLSQYHFRHNLIQKYLYNNLDEVEREYLHEDVGNALEELYGEQAGEIAVQLAWHFEEAGIAEKAVSYHIQAGDRAKEQYAHEAAIDHYQKAVALLKAQEDLEQAAQISMQLGLLQHQIFDFEGSRQAYEEAFALQQQVGQSQQKNAPATLSSSAPQSLRIGWMTEPITLDPALALDETTLIIGQLFSGLVALTPEMDVIPDVARRWEVLDEGRKYIFHLRDDVRWSDGSPVTAHDFEYAWKRILDPSLAARSPVASVLYDVKGAKVFHQGEVGSEVVGIWAIDAVTLAIDLEGPTGYFLNLLAQCATFPVPRHSLETHGEAWAAADKIVTNGPFRLESWERGARLLLTRNETYHGRFQGNLQRVELTLLGDYADISGLNVRSLTLYETDKLDVINLWEGADQVRQQHAAEYISLPIFWTAFVSLNPTQPPFNDPRVRRALALALDREKYVREVRKGQFVPATGGFIPPGMPGHSEGIALPYDPAQARQLLAEAGYPEGQGFPKIKGIAGTRQGMENLQAQWRESLGIELEGEVLEWDIYLERLERQPPHLYVMSDTADYPDPDYFLRLFFTREYYFKWHNESYESLIEEVTQLTDQKRRIQLYQQADQILVEDVPLIPLYYFQEHFLVKPWVRNYLQSPTKTAFWKDVIIEPH